MPHTHTHTHTHIHVHLTGLGGEDEDELEAELLAALGEKPSGKGKKKAESGGMTTHQLDSMIAGLKGIGEEEEGEEDDEDLSDIDEEELLGELQVCVCGREFHTEEGIHGC